jgi:hypothetical protein
VEALAALPGYLFLDGASEDLISLIQGRAAWSRPRYTFRAIFLVIRAYRRLAIDV